MLTGISSFTQFVHSMLAHLELDVAFTEHLQLSNQACSTKLVWNTWRLKNWSQTKWHVFFSVLGEKLLQNNKSPWNFSLWGCKAAALSLIWNNFSVLCGKTLTCPSWDL